MDECLKNASVDKIELLVKEVLEGRKAHDITMSFHDWSFKSMCSLPPEDSSNDSRARSTVSLLM